MAAKRNIAPAPPGSPRAKRLGCRCSGDTDIDGEFWITAGCPVHTNEKNPHYIPLRFEFVESDQ